MADLIDHLRINLRAPPPHLCCTAPERAGLLWAYSAHRGLEFTLGIAHIYTGMQLGVPSAQDRGPRAVQAAHFAAVGAFSSCPYVIMTRGVCHLLMLCVPLLVHRKIH